jgi:hypothetical protein
VIRLRKKRPYVHKPNFGIRDKTRPIGQKFNVEVRLRPVVDVPLRRILKSTNYLNNKEIDFYNEWSATMATIREMIGGQYKIINHRRILMIKTKILLDREADLIMIILAHPTMVCKAYRYV